MSLKKIAELAGTSVATVSRVLNDTSRKCNDAELKERILNAATEIGYVPNVAAKNLKSGVGNSQKPFVVDILLTRFNSLNSDYFFKELYESIREEMLRKNCVFGRFLNLPDIQSLDDKTSFSKKNTGLIILGKCPKEVVAELKKKYSYMVGVDRNPTDYEYDEIVCSGTSAAVMAMDYLISLGHRKIAYIGDCTYETRYIGYYQALINNNIPLDYNYVYPSDQTKEGGYNAYLSILEKDNLPTAIFCANDAAAIGTLEAIKKHRRKGYIPSVISIDNICQSEKTSPMLTTVDIPKRDMGHFAVTVLVDKMSGVYDRNIRVMFPCKLVIRESCTYCT